MNDVHNFEVDPDGFHYDPRARVTMARLIADGGDPLAFEAASAVRTAYRAIERTRTQGSEGRGLSAGALDVLVRLDGEERRLSIGELARAAGVSSRNVTGLVDTLERDGLVRRVPDETDRRSVLAEITPAGRAWLDAFRKPAQAAMRAMFRGFTPEELVVFRDLCLRLADNQIRLSAHLRQNGQHDDH